MPERGTCPLGPGACSRVFPNAGDAVWLNQWGAQWRKDGGMRGTWTFATLCPSFLALTRGPSSLRLSCCPCPPLKVSLINPRTQDVTKIYLSPATLAIVLAKMPLSAHFWPRSTPELRALPPGVLAGRSPRRAVIEVPTDGCPHFLISFGLVFGAFLVTQEMIRPTSGE